MEEKIYTYKAKAWDRLKKELDEMKDDEMISVKALKDSMSIILTTAFNDRILSGKQMAGILSDFVNIFNSDNEGFVNEVVRRTHKTLQQSIFKLFIDCVEEWAKLEDYQYDLRNKATVEMSKEIVDKIKDRRLPMI